MANVLFKQGTQSALDAIKNAKAGIDGAFYLTNDSHRLYIGVSGGDVLPVNEGVTTVQSTLPTISADNRATTTGQFYYVADKNILCVYNGNQWVQINPNSDTHIKDVSYTVTATGDVATIKVATQNYKADGTTKEGLEISDSYSIKGDKGVKVTAADKQITIAGDEYSLSSSLTGNTETITLTSANTDNDTSIKITKGSNITFTHTDADGLVIAAKDTTLKAADGLTVANTANSGNGFLFTATDTSGAAPSATFDPVIKVGTVENTTTESIHFVDGVASLPVYTKSEVDNMMVGLNAMVYKGTISSSTGLESSDIAKLNIGDVYMVTATTGATMIVPRTSGENYRVAANKGDLFIAKSATGKEDAITGYIALDNLEFDVVPSGDDSNDTTYQLKPQGNGVKLVGSTNPNGSVGTFVLATGEDGKIVITANPDATTNSQTLTLTHAAITQNDTNNTTATKALAQAVVNNKATDLLTATVVTGVTRDASGHVTGITTQKYEMVNGGTIDNSHTITAESNVATIKSTVKFTTAAGSVTTKDSSFTLGSNSLNVTATGSAVTVDLVWGTFTAPSTT